MTSSNNDKHDDNHDVGDYHNNSNNDSNDNNDDGKNGNNNLNHQGLWCKNDNDTTILVFIKVGVIPILDIMIISK